MSSLDVFSYLMQVFVPLALMWLCQSIFGNNSNDRLNRIENRLVNRLMNIEAGVANIQMRMINVEGQVANLQVDMNNVQGQMANMQGQMANMQAQIVVIQAQNTQQQNRIDALGQDMDALKQTVREITHLAQRR